MEYSLYCWEHVCSVARTRGIFLYSILVSKTLSCDEAERKSINAIQAPSDLYSIRPTMLSISTMHMQNSIPFCPIRNAQERKPNSLSPPNFTAHVYSFTSSNSDRSRHKHPTFQQFPLSTRLQIPLLSSRQRFLTAPPPPPTLLSLHQPGILIPPSFIYKSITPPLGIRPPGA